MANVKYFADINTYTIELATIFGVRNAEFAAKFPGIVGKRYDSFTMLLGYPKGSGEMLPVTREITYKAFPSKHECDARCMNATGRTMNCECSCGGKNHGKGSFKCD